MKHKNKGIKMAINPLLARVKALLPEVCNWYI